MRFDCPACHAPYLIADEKVGARGIRVRCKRCPQIIVVRPFAHRGGPQETPLAASAPADSDLTPGRAPDGEAEDEQRFTLSDLGSVLLPGAPSSLSALQTVYRRALIPKRSGALRELWIPSDDLAFVQRRINRFMLSAIRPHAASHAYTAHRSIATNAARHAGARLVVKLDLENFFPSVTTRQVRAFWSTWCFNLKAGDRRRWGRFEDEVAARLTELTCWNGGLPQGAPTSPAISNLCAYRLDVRLSALAEQLGATYTRYSDDLTFSFARTPEWQHHFLRRAAADVIVDEGFRVNLKKSNRFFTAKERLEVTGLVVNETPNLKREQRRRMRAAHHRRAMGLPLRDGDYTDAQLAGWDALDAMVRKKTGRDARRAQDQGGLEAVQPLDSTTEGEE